MLNSNVISFNTVIVRTLVIAKLTTPDGVILKAQCWDLYMLPKAVCPLLASRCSPLRTDWSDLFSKTAPNRTVDYVLLSSALLVAPHVAVQNAPCGTLSTVCHIAGDRSIRVSHVPSHSVPTIKSE